MLWLYLLHLNLLINLLNRFRLFLTNLQINKSNLQINKPKKKLLHLLIKVWLKSFKYCLCSRVFHSSIWFQLSQLQSLTPLHYVNLISLLIWLFSRLVGILLVQIISRANKFRWFLQILIKILVILKIVCF